MTAVMRLFGIRLRISGVENLVDRPTMFVSNHFTRLDTFLIPYVVSSKAGKQVRTLATHRLFQGVSGAYLRAVGTMSTRDPQRNRTIIRDLMTGANDWVIYPEGMLIKSKKAMCKRRLHLDHPTYQGPPRTGAALLALKAEVARRRFAAAHASNDGRKLAYYRQSYGLERPEELRDDSPVVVPITMTFYPLRPARNAMNRIARLFSRNIDPTLDEELQTDGRILSGKTEIIVHFGEPIEVADYLGKVPALARRIVGAFSETRQAEMFLSRQARRLTDDSMRRVYHGSEVNLDHLVCYLLRVMRHDRVEARDFRGVLFLTAKALSERDDVRVHPTLSNGIHRLMTDETYEPFQRALRLAADEHVIVQSNGSIRIDRDQLEADHEFHRIRLDGMVQVLANEFETVEPAREVMTQIAAMPTDKLRQRVEEALHDTDRERFRVDHQDSYDSSLSKPKGIGEPFYFEGQADGVGVLLIHGYLASPEQMRPLAQYLHRERNTVYAVRLKGHGTSPRELTQVSCDQWLESVDHGLEILRQRCRHIIVAGFSLGGALALLTAARQGDAIAGVVSINAPILLRDRRAAFVPAIVCGHAVLRRLGIRSDDLRRPWYQSSSPDTSYEIDYLTGVRELASIVRQCRRELPRVSAPALIVQAQDDPTVRAESGRYILSRLGSSARALSEPDFDRHLIIRGEGAEPVFELMVGFVRKAAHLADGKALVDLAGPR